ncbi:MAG: HAMP domain-containing sensor histidine kinase [Gemmatimonadales bacterium]|jgi:signal transduction histidine kinase
MRLTFRHRIFLGLVGLGTLPFAAALVILAFQVRSTSSPSGPRAAIERIAATGREAIATLDTTRLTAAERAALRAHADTIARGTTLARRAEYLSDTAAGALAVLILAGAVVLVALSITLARRLSTYTSAPIEELVEWVRRIELGQPLPAEPGTAGAPEFEALRHALREMAAALERARQQEVERERLRAFRETARRVAHELRSPVNAAQLALRRLTGGPPGDARTEQATAVLDDELRRLERMAQEFSEFGRLPEGPESEIDVTDLARGVIESTMPPEYPTDLHVENGLTVRGHYEPLRRAVQNVVRNALQADDGRGLTVRAVRAPDGGLELSVADHGTGVPAERRSQIFEPYVTDTHVGTGLGLALVRQTVEAHGGTVRVEDAPGGGARFVISIPPESR